MLKNLEKNWIVSKKKFLVVFKTFKRNPRKESFLENYEHFDEFLEAAEVKLYQLN